LPQRNNRLSVRKARPARRLLGKARGGTIGPSTKSTHALIDQSHPRVQVMNPPAGSRPGFFGSRHVRRQTERLRRETR
jgi:hypothetical protein